MKLRNACILIVDDNEGTRRLVRMLLRDLGVQNILMSSCIEDALTILHCQHVDLILTDWEMIGETGMDLMALVRRNDTPRISEIPIVMMTAHSEEWRVHAARDAGVTDFLVKPISPAQLEAKLRAALLRVREFIRTPGYCGPDRRRAQRPYAGPDRRGAHDESEAAMPIDLTEAENTMRHLRGQFEVFFGEAAVMIAAELRSAGIHPAQAATCCDRIFQLAHNLKGQGSSFGYPLATDIAAELCDYLRSHPQPDGRDLAVIGGYAAALDTVARNRISGDGGSLGRSIVGRLRAFTTA